MAGFILTDLYEPDLQLVVSDHAAMGSLALAIRRVHATGDYLDIPENEAPYIHLAEYKLAELLRWCGAKVEEPSYWRDPSMVEISIPAEGQNAPRP